MKLPSVTTPEYKVKIPSGKELTIRPFLAQEEKILLMAIEDSEKNEQSLQDALVQVLRNCIVKPADFDVMKLSAIDVDYLFVELRKKSVSDIVTLQYETASLFEDCDEKTCPEIITVKFSLNDVEVKTNNTNNIVMLNDSVGLKLRYPTLGGSTTFNGGVEKKTDLIFHTIADCIDQIFDEDNSADGEKFPRDELVEWIGKSVNHAAMEQIMQFITDAPYLSKKITVTCPTCGNKKEMEAKGLSDFFI